MTIPDRIRRLHAGALVIDGHVHPPLKTLLFHSNLAKAHRSGGSFNPFTTRVDLPKAVAGCVDAFVAVTYLPEPGLLADCAVLRLLARFAPRRIRRLFTGDPLQHTLGLIADFESALAWANAEGRELARPVRSTDALLGAVDDGVIAVVHAVEGGHSLGGQPDGIAMLAERGVAMLTLAHFYPNEVASPVHGIPPSMRRFGCFKTAKDLSAGLGPIGPQVVEEMVRRRMLIDLTHCTPKARAQVYDIVGRRRPLVFSHVGVQPLADDPMSPTAAEIRTVAAGGGVIGVILINEWLGARPHGDGLDHVVATVREIAAVGGFDTVAIGSDLDGFTDPPDDLPDISRLPRLTEALDLAGLSSGEIEKVLGRNWERVLRDGWR